MTGLLALIQLPFLAPAAMAQSAAIITAGVGGCLAPGSSASADTSGDGRWLAFVGSSCTAGSGTNQAYLRDLDSGTTELVSIPAPGLLASPVSSVAVSDDGNRVAFTTSGVQNGFNQAFVRDRAAGTTTLVSVDPTGQPAASGIQSAVLMSSDGRYVAFTSVSVLVAGDVDNDLNIFVRDTQLGSTERIPAARGTVGLDLLDLSADGRHVLFWTAAALDPSDTNGVSDVYAADLDNLNLFEDVGRTAQGATFPDGTQYPAFTTHGMISGDGTRVLFVATGSSQIYVRDRSTTTVTEVGVDALGVNTLGATVTMDETGYYVAFATNGFGPLDPVNGYQGFRMSDGTVVGGSPDICGSKNQLLLRDLHAGTVELISKNTAGNPAGGGPAGVSDCNGTSYPAVGISAGGQYVTFASNRLDLVSPALSPSAPPDLYRADRAFVPAPVNTVAPTLSGTVAVGEPVTCDPGTWTPSAGVGFDYEWLLNGAVVPGQTATSYVIALADSGKGLACRVTATNAGGAATALSAVSPVPTVSAPVNLGGVDAPRITGTVAIGTTVTCQPGTWAATPAADYFYDWFAGSTALPGATAATYTLSATDAGKTLTCHVTAVNVAGSAVAVSNPIALPAKPVNTRLPVISANQNPARVGTALTCTSGSWSGTPTYSYRWTRNGTSVIDFPNTVRTYTVTAADLGSAIGCVVRASNGGGSTTAAPLSAISVPAAPTLTAPRITYTAPLRLRTVLSCVAGTVTPATPSPTLAFRWTRNGTAIAGQTTNRHTVVAADLGQAIRCEEQATNTSGSSAWTASLPVLP